MALKHKIKHNLLRQIFSIQSRAKDFQSIFKTWDQFYKAFCYLVFIDAKYDCIIGMKSIQWKKNPTYMYSMNILFLVWMES